MGVLRFSISDARRFHRRALLLNAPLPDIGSALTHLGFVQIDPINVCGRMHDLILRNRVSNYRENDLMGHLHGVNGAPITSAQRTAFEHHLPHTNVLTALTLDAWPHLLAAMRTRSSRIGSWSGKMDSRQRELANAILAEINARGPLCSDDIDDDQRDHQGWGPHSSLAKTTLHKLFFHGRVLIARRVGNRRYYDLPERVLPPLTLAAPEPSASETRRWLTILELRQRRLVAMPSARGRQVSDLVQEIAVEGCPRISCLREDLPLLDFPESPTDPLLLAPLDPMIYDRRLTEVLWNYSYRWEVYTPAARRVRGYYALPVLVDTEIVGHIDPKADRINKKLVVIKRSLRRGYRAAPAVLKLADFLGLKRSR